MSCDLYMPQDRYVVALERMRDRIASGVPLRYFDDTTPGNKDTQCTWGLCAGDKASWPDAQDHLWPDLFLKSDRIAPLYRKPMQKCPMDRRDLQDKNENGCFYTCRVFKPKKNDPRVAQEFALALYDARIAEVKP